MDARYANQGEQCPYCGNPVSPNLYFCQRCGTPYKAPESVLAPLPDLPMDTETLVRTRAPQALNLFLWFIGVLIALQVAVAVIFDSGQSLEAEIFKAVVLAIPTVIFSVIYFDALKVQFCRIGFDCSAAYVSLLILVPTLIVNFAYHSFWHQLFGWGEPEGYGGFEMSGAAVIVFWCFAPAVIEEIAFRGLIQHWLHAAVDPWKAIMIAAVLFRVAHFQVLSAPYLFGGGVLFGWARWKTGSLYPPMLLHFLHNFFVVIL
ncbi:MAG: CPBP family glutamic-type intramembrane protease [Verrucomicrobiales bacterium]|nr:CPBP family glutamic-type intramembrane protease [Verrucomicrobiales bacterium]